MIKITRLVAATGILLAVATPALAQDASRAAPGAAPETETGGAGDKAAKQDKGDDQAKPGTEGNGDSPASAPGGCPYIKRKLELIV
jgi:hypothetical protein